MAVCQVQPGQRPKAVLACPQHLIQSLWFRWPVVCAWSLGTELTGLQQTSPSSHAAPSKAARGLGGQPSRPANSVVWASQSRVRREAQESMKRQWALAGPSGESGGKGGFQADATEILGKGDLHSQFMTYKSQSRDCRGLRGGVTS